MKAKKRTPKVSELRGLEVPSFEASGLEVSSFGTRSEVDSRLTCGSGSLGILTPCRGSEPRSFEFRSVKLRIPKCGWVLEVLTRGIGYLRG